MPRLLQLFKIIGLRLNNNSGQKIIIIYLCNSEKLKQFCKHHHKWSKLGVYNLHNYKFYWLTKVDRGTRSKQLTITGNFPTLNSINYFWQFNNLFFSFSLIKLSFKNNKTEADVFPDRLWFLRVFPFLS